MEAAVTASAIIPSEEDPLLSTDDIAKIFGVKRKTVAGWIHEGKLTAVKIAGRYWRVQRSEMVRFANERYGENAK